MRMPWLAGGLLMVASAQYAHAFNVTTYHYDNLRSGWNPSETILTPANVGGGSFGVVATASTDAQIDAQPLIVQGLTIGGQKHDVTFVATENNSIYALDATTGVLLAQTNLGPALPPSKLNPHHEQEGIQSTPVIDTSASTMFVVAIDVENRNPVYRLHAIDLVTLIDKVPSVVISAVNQLDDGTQIQFNPAEQRQRPALLEANGNIYAAFGSWGDAQDLSARGWLLGWNAATLAPLSPNILTNHLSTELQCGQNRVQPCFLSSIWMSGSGVAADSAGNIYVVTGNSAMGTYDGVENIQQSTVKLSSDLSHVLDIFTPWNVDHLDAFNLDFGSGGVTLLPDQPLPLPHLAVAAGKSGTLYLLNRDDLGGHVQQKPDRVPGEYKIGRCWCAQSYFTGSDGIGRVVTSGGRAVGIWRFANGVALQNEHTSASLASGQDPGFFTSVSSNGLAGNTAVIWAVARPQSLAGTLTLYGFDATTAATLVSLDAGVLPNVKYNANVVPVVANGYVYVAGGSHLSILGASAKAAKSVSFSGPDPARAAQLPGHEVYGTVNQINGPRLTITLRTGTRLHVDAEPAIQKRNAEQIVVGEAMVIDGWYDSKNVLHAEGIFRAKQSPALWPLDR